MLSLRAATSTVSGLENPQQVPFRNPVKSLVMAAGQAQRDSGCYQAARLHTEPCCACPASTSKRTAFL